MQKSTLSMISVLLLMAILSSCDGRLFMPDADEIDDDLEISQAEARNFLQDNADQGDNNNIDKRITSNDCVLCKFNMIPCCKPSICVKKHFRPDECMEIKGK